MHGVYQQLSRKLSRLLGSPRLYWVVIGFLAFEALWIALSARYPMAFDEDFHFGVIKIYSGHVHPFLPGQPDGANAFGALAADPSYLYHYAMSFPFRLISFITNSQTAQVIFLRLINIAVFSGAVVLFRKVLLRAGASQSLVTISTLLFALIPTVPLLAGQINYDSLLLLSLAWVCWLTLQITEDLQARRVDITHLVFLAASLMLACLVKYAFLPIALAVALYISILALVCFWHRAPQFGRAIKKGYHRLDRPMKVGLLVLCAVSGLLFAQRYVVNVVRYASPIPDCDAVIGVDACLAYGPWARNYHYALAKPEFTPQPLDYTWQWFQGLHYRLFFTITGPPRFTNYPPSPLPSAAAITLALCGVVSLIFYWRKIFTTQPYFVFLIGMAAIYVAVLWFQNYSQYKQTGQPVAINGRYLIPLILPLCAVFGRGMAQGLRLWPKAKVYVSILAIILFVQGGGIVSFILRSDETWYWPNRTVVSVNQNVQKVLKPIIFEGPKAY
jgi:hypothetical protein